MKFVMPRRIFILCFHEPSHRFVRACHQLDDDKHMLGNMQADLIDECHFGLIHRNDRQSWQTGIAVGDTNP